MVAPKKIKVTSDFNAFYISLVLGKSHQTIITFYRSMWKLYIIFYYVFFLCKIKPNMQTLRFSIYISYCLINIKNAMEEPDS